MRAFEIRRFSPLRCANVVAVVLAALYGALAVLMAPILIGVSAIVSNLPATPGAGRHPGPPGFPTWVPLVFVVLYPVMGAVFGWIGGGLGALAYNFVVQYTGGIEVELDETVTERSV